MHPTCLKTFILAYTSNPQGNEFGWAFGRDSPIADNQIKSIVEKEIENLDADQMIHSISSLIAKLRATAIENINASLSGQDCDYQRNQSQVMDIYGLLSDCDKVKIDYELEELERQTRINESTYACDQRGLRGAVVIAGNESAALLADKIYQALYTRADMYNRLCKKFFVFVYSVDRQELRMRVGLDSPIAAEEMKAIAEDQIKHVGSVYQFLHAIGSMISNIRIGALDNMIKRKSDQHCRYQPIKVHIIDPYGLLSDCQKSQIYDTLTELQQQTIRNQSSDACDHAGLTGILIVAKNESAPDVAQEYYKYMYRNSSKLAPHLNCRNSLILAYSYETHDFGLFVGTDSPLNSNEIKPILDQTIRNGSADQWIDVISSLVLSIQAATVKKLSTKDSVEKFAVYFDYFYQIALKIGLLGNVLCIVAILFTKLIKNAVNKYLLILLISDTLFILWIFARDQRLKMETWDFWTCTFISYMPSSTMSASSNILVLLTMERFFAIIFPLHHMQYSHINRWLIMLITLLPMQIYTLYFYLRPYFDSGSVTIFENGKCYHEGMFNIQMNNIPFHLSLFILPLLTIIFVNSAIAIKLRQQRNGKVNSTKPKDGSNETLWILPTIYVLFSTPLFITILVEKFFYPTSPSYLINGVDLVVRHVFMLDFVYNWFFYAMTR
ncbi:7 transmembrane receptor (rhodopsin family) domain-containing protein [Ditylenchus destructor]|nr:7 transmembrane receptor (rhodopsin family) domain-containing protein [Ditylenchus destructor]